MKRLFVESFNGYEIQSVIWRNRPCWVGVKMAKLVGYEEPSHAVTNCIRTEKFREEVEYEVLVGANLKKFKELLGTTIEDTLKFASQLIIFFEPGLYGFLQYTEKPLGVTFRTWIREEVVPQIRATGAYVLDDEYYEKTYNSDIEFACGNFDNSKDNLKVNSEVIVKDSKVNLSLEVRSHNKNVVEKIADNVIIFDKYLDGLSIADEDKFLFLVSLYKSANIDIDLSFINSHRI